MRRHLRIRSIAVLAAAGTVMALAALPAQASTATAPAAGAASATADSDALGDDPAAQTMGGGLGTLDSGLAATKLAAAPAVNTKGGNMFDTCDTPSLADMTAWLASPYRTVGIYIGGIARGCKTQKNLTPSWIVQTSAMGWSHVPIYVGLQAPCTKYTNKISLNEATANAQGRQAALDGIVQMKALGIGPQVPLYLDMENYSIANGPCSVSVRAFTDGWTRELQAKGYLSGIYGSASSMTHHIQAWTKAGGYAAPDYVWFARWNGIATADEPELDPDTWAGRRIHQFTGGHKETWGGVTINIDSNFIQSFSTAPSVVTALRPTQIWDSKSVSVGTKPVRLAVGGVAGIPREATAAVLSIEIAHPTAAGELIVEPRGGVGVPLSSQSFAKGQQVSTTVVVPLSARAIQFRTTAGKARVIVKANGYLTTPATDAVDGISAVEPHVVWDSKSASLTTKPLALALRGVSGIPSDASSAILSVQVVGPTADGSLFVEPYGAGSSAAVQQFTKGRSATATVTVPLSSTTRAAQFRLSAGKARLIVSVLGYTSPSSIGRLTVTAPAQLWDSKRATLKTSPTGLAVAGRNEIPLNATAVLLTVRVVNPSATADLLIEPRGSRTGTRALSLVRGQSGAITVLVPVTNRAVQMRLSAGSARVIVNTVGYVTDYVAPPTDDGSGDIGDWDDDTDGNY